MMNLECVQCDFAQIEALRGRFRGEMGCQILRDSFHARPGWVEWYSLAVERRSAGYGAVVVGGPWEGSRALFEVYLLPEFRRHALSLTGLVARSARAEDVLVQTNDAMMLMVMFQFGRDPQVEALIFEHGAPTGLPNPGVTLVRNGGSNLPPIFAHEREPVGDWLLQYRGEVVATGGYLSHYNPPYVDIYMEVRADMRRKGFGSYLVQEICRIAEASGKIACARCDVDNEASMKTLARAGMVPCAHRVTAKLK
jgi:hypothetical protein